MKYDSSIWVYGHTFSDNLIHSFLDTQIAYKEVYDLPNNPVAEILINGKEVLVPLNLMIELDKKNQKIYIEIPEGLVDL